MATVAPKNTPRWRVAIVDDHERSRAAIRAAVWSAGGEVAGEAVRCADAMAMVTQARPAVVSAAVGLPDGEGVDVAAAVTQEAGCPVVLITSRPRDDLITRAQAARGLAYLIK